jgi:hypothetical protein
MRTGIRVLNMVILNAKLSDLSCLHKIIYLIDDISLCNK